MVAVHFNSLLVAGVHVYTNILKKSEELPTQQYAWYCSLVPRLSLAYEICTLWAWRIPKEEIKGGGGGLGLLTRMPQEKSVVSSWSPSNPAISQVVIRGTSSQRAPSVVVLPNAERHIQLPQTGAIAYLRRELDTFWLFEI